MSQLADDGLPSHPGLTEQDTCRICRGEALVDEPLYHPCKCSGSIKFVHQNWYVLLAI